MTDQPLPDASRVITRSPPTEFPVAPRKAVTVDVREDLRQGREPFSKIMSAVSALRADEQLRLIAPFEPVPLFRVMEKRGFDHDARPLATGDWEVLFTRQSEPSTAEATRSIAGGGPSNGGPPASAPRVDVDARGLEPPQPMVRILEAVATLPAGVELTALTDRRPMHLYPRLEERGFTAETEEQPDGSFLTHIRRR